MGFFKPKELRKRVGFRKYLPVRHFEGRSNAELWRDFLVKARKSLTPNDLKIVLEGREGNVPVYSILARTRRQRTMASKLIRKMQTHGYTQLRKRKG